MVCMPLNCIASGATFQQHHTTVMTTDKGHLRYRRRPRIVAYAISRVLYSTEMKPLSFIYDCNHLQPPATYPPTSDEQPLIVGIHGLATHETY